MGILESFRLDGKVALVTGSNRGLGKAMALALAEAGADIAGLDYFSNFAEIKAELEACGRRFAFIQCDLRQASVADLGKVVDDVVSTMGRLDILVNNAGIIRRTPAVDFSEMDWDDVMQINLKAAFFLSQAAGRVMLKQGSGKIVNIASLLSFQGGILIPSYTASKSGIAGITRLLANEWAGRGVNVNAIAPGYMATDNTAALREDPNRNQSILSRIPAGRWGLPADLMGTVVFLCSQAASYLHGTIIPVDGGWLTR